MTEEELKGKSFDYKLSTIMLLTKNNALLESLADLIIKVNSNNDDKTSKELNDYFVAQMKIRKEDAMNVLVE